MKVSIRPIRFEDVDTVRRYASDELVSRTTNIPSPYPENAAESFVKCAIEGWGNRKCFVFGIIVDDEMVGDINLNKPDFEKHTIQCDYAISSLHWGRGIGTEAIGFAVAFAFQKLDMKMVTSACLKRNPASASVLEKNGFVETGKFIYNNNKFKDEPALWFQLTKEDWLQRDS